MWVAHGGFHQKESSEFIAAPSGGRPTSKHSRAEGHTLPSASRTSRPLVEDTFTIRAAKLRRRLLEAASDLASRRTPTRHDEAWLIDASQLTIVASRQFELDAEELRGLLWGDIE